MTYQEIKNLIESIGLPYAYYEFEDNTNIAPPFVVFFYDYSDEYADNENYAEKVTLNVELYTDYKDIELEKTVEAVLRKAELTYTKESTRINSERMWQTAYTTEVFING